MKICILGASGQVGSVLFDSLRLQAGVTVKPVVHNLGNAWGILRSDCSLAKADLRSYKEAEAAIAGSSHVVNCSLGQGEEMLRMMDNILRACEVSNVKRLVHLSSVTVYGDPPPSSSSDESGHGSPLKYSYGWYKAAQDRAFFKAVNRGLSGVVLCPPHVIGSSSRFVLRLIDSAKAGRLPIVGGGDLPCNLVDVDNLCYAIRLALTGEARPKTRLYVTNGDELTWGGVANSVARLAAVPVSKLPNVRVSDVPRISAKKWPIVRFLYDVARSRELRSAVALTAPMRVPAFRSTASKVLRLIRRSVHGERPIGDNPSSGALAYDEDLGQLQLRNVRHSIKRAEQELGYRPQVSFEQSMANFTKWYQRHHGVGGTWWQMLQNLKG